MTTATIHETLDLHQSAIDVLDAARAHPSGRTARTLTPGAGTPLKQVLLAMTAGSVLQDHHAPGPATLQVVVGSIVLAWEDHEAAISAGQWTTIPDAIHGVTATQDAVVLLTVAPSQPAPPTD